MGQCSCWKEREKTLNTENTNHVHWQKMNPEMLASSSTYIGSADMMHGKINRDGFTGLKESANMENEDTFPCERSFAESIILAAHHGSSPIPIRPHHGSSPIPIRRNLSPAMLKAPRAISISYTHSSHLGSDNESARIEFDESLVETLVALAPATRNSISQKLSLSRLSFKKIKKKVRFNEQVIIHTIEYKQPKRIYGVSDTYLLIVTLREIWSKLDLDKDGYLNMVELERFCLELWVETNVDIPIIMRMYAKTDQNKGLTFHEWCKLVKDEDPEMDTFVDDLYDIFVEPSTSEPDYK